MMRYEDTAELEDKTSCSGLRADLKMCLLESDCCRVKKKTPRECLQTKDPDIPDNCLALKNLFFECKRSLLDNRTRFRGRRGY
ncbi:cytochrome c oxidase assembly factor 5 [Homalodisca vitripennis]|uniref:cytochrome c oxidase assembly factor 5 n=1 Tax=Homalodisca vitripennis TaxID=197043 RepID=UPI001EEBBDC4|nr:cytochrome c oxidase assembly factor 5 [Homalodisca vitripennis]XP_046670660.1 cytochrome c oxidase assembly factor 5 [Homalodisca vitripennis]XP_046670661.1 cytochrome c oxidase assembly factor 5 [Homalodisca vitripennis]